MATHYIDPIGGNDARGGTSFANRKKTPASIAGLAAGDTIRMIESRAPISMGSIAWTDASRSLTLNSSLTLEIDPCTAAWTASTNVTCSANASRKYGSTASRFVVASGFTTGQCAFKATAATVNASAYTAVSFWLNVVVAGSMGGQALTLKLCSDTGGVTSVKDILIDFGQTASIPVGWIPVFIDTGAALPSNINSIRLDWSADPGSCTFQLNNLFACQGLAHADHISLRSLMGKNTGGEPEWYPINSINGTAVTIGTYASVQASLGPAYKGTTETVTTYQLVPTYPNWTSAQRTFPAVSGTEASRITVSFGWDSTAMTTQSGVTAWCGMGFMGGLWTLANDWWVFSGSNAYFINAIDAYSLSAGSEFVDMTFGQIIGMQTNTQLNCIGNMSTLALDAIVWNDTYHDVGPAVANVVGNTRIRRVTGCNDASNPAVFVSSVSMNDDGLCDVWIDKIDNNMGTGVGVGSGNNGKMRGCTLENNAVADVRTSAGFLILDNCKLNSTTKVNTDPPTTATAGCLLSNSATSEDHRIWKPGWRAFTQNTTRQVASGVAWQVQPTSTTLVNSMAPAVIPLARIAVSDTGAVTVTCYVQRSSTSLTIGIRAKGGQVAGLTTTQSATTAAAANTWDQLTLTFTPTVKGVVEIEGFCYGGTTLSGYFDTLAVSQV